MIDLEIFPKNHFDSDRISNESMDQFSTDHLHRMVANNPGEIYTPLIEATRLAYNNFNDAIINETSSKSQKEGATVNLRISHKAFVQLVVTKEGIIRGTWGKGSAVYERFFPHGKKEYRRAKKGNIQVLMLRFISACNDHSGELPENFVDQFITIKTNYDEARTLQLHHIGTAVGNKLAVATTRKVLEIQLMINLLTISKNNVGKPEVIKVYFDQSIIRRPKD